MTVFASGPGISRDRIHFRTFARERASAKMSAEENERETGQRRRRRWSTRTDRLVRDASRDAVRSEHRNCVRSLSLSVSGVSLFLSPLRSRSTADRGYLRIRAPRGRSRADGTQCHSYRTTDIHHFGKHTGHVIPAGPGPPLRRGSLLPLPQKTARLATEISSRRDTRRLSHLGDPKSGPTAGPRITSSAYRELSCERHENGTVRRHAEYLAARARAVATTTARPPYRTTMRTTARVNRCSNGRRSAASASTGCSERMRTRSPTIANSFDTRQRKRSTPFFCFKIVWISKA